MFYATITLAKLSQFAQRFLYRQSLTVASKKLMNELFKEACIYARKYPYLVCTKIQFLLSVNRASLPSLILRGRGPTVVQCACVEMICVGETMMH